MLFLFMREMHDHSQLVLNNSYSSNYYAVCIYNLDLFLRINLNSYFYRMYYIEEFEDAKGIIIICITKKNRQHNGQKKKYKRANNDLQNIHIKQKIE
jgi:hypothetical protein